MSSAAGASKEGKIFNLAIKPAYSIYSEPKSEFKGYGSDWLLSSLKEAPDVSNSATHNPRKELLDYLKSKLASTKNPVEWWGVRTSMLSHLFLLSDILQKNAKDFPTLARIARDYLAIQGSSVASERAFSSGGLTDTLQRNRMQPFLFGRVQILKHAYKTHVLDASVEASAHPEHRYISI